jgi:hypothetical protein
MLRRMYTSPDDARSDLFLSAAVYLFGPLVIGTLLNLVPVPVVLGAVLGFGIPLVVTVLVPWLLIRYRKESLRSYGFVELRAANVGLGLLAAAPLAAASVLMLPGLGRPAFVTMLSIDGGARLSRWLGLCLLGVYGTVKARDAFRQDYLTVREGLRDIGRWVALVALGAAALLILSQTMRGASPLDALRLLLLPLGMIGALAVVHRSLRGPNVTSRQVLLTPTVLLALGPFGLSLNGAVFLTSLYRAALAGGVGLLAGALIEAKRTARAVVALAAAIALFTLFDLV